MIEATVGKCDLFAEVGGQHCGFREFAEVVRSWRDLGYTTTEVRTLLCQADVPAVSRQKDCPVYRGYCEANKANGARSH